MVKGKLSKVNSDEEHHPKSEETKGEDDVVYG